MKDFHVHTVWSDGDDTMEDTVLAAIGKGLTEIGFSDHSYTYFDESYCIKKERISAYIAEAARLKEKYRDKIKILCGIEQDYWSEESTEGFDYVIGSVHYIKVGDTYIPVDESADILREGCDKYFGGDMYALCEAYFETVSDVVRRTGADIIGHFDLITKFSERETLYDTQNPRYVAAWKRAVDALLTTGVPFEINTGAMSRGYRTSPYPSEEIRRYITSHGGKTILSSDSHAKEKLCYGFENME